MTATCQNCWAEHEPSKYSTKGCCSRACAIRLARGKLNAADVAEIIEEHAKGLSFRVIAKAFGVSYNCVFRIVHKKAAA